MEIPKNNLNKIYVILSILGFISSWIPTLSEIQKSILLLASILLLIIIYFSHYFRISDDIVQKLRDLEKKVDNFENLIKMRSDIELIKKVLKI
ncbi:MAG: hypothetical protein AABY15_01025 [Nanoarchaeota archaeon]